MPRTKCYAKRIEAAESRIEVAMRQMKEALESALCVVVTNVSREHPDDLVVAKSYGSNIPPSVRIEDTHEEISTGVIEACRDQFHRVFKQYGPTAIPTVQLKAKNGKLVDREDEWWL